MRYPQLCGDPISITSNLRILNSDVVLKEQTQIRKLRNSQNKKSDAETSDK
jgi:hypothetical protein